jgi:hypothetical protein
MKDEYGFEECLTAPVAVMERLKEMYADDAYEKFWVNAESGTENRFYKIQDDFWCASQDEWGPILILHEGRYWLSDDKNRDIYGWFESIEDATRAYLDEDWNPGAGFGGSTDADPMGFPL